MTVVLSFGSARREPVYTAYRRVVPPEHSKILVVPIADEEELMYRGFDGTIEQALESVAIGRNVSVQVEAPALLVALYRPRFAGQVLADWLALAEGAGLDFEAAYEELQRIDGLGYVALSKEEAPDFRTDHVTAETFPWSDWRLLAGAVRAASGEWLFQGK